MTKQTNDSNRDDQKGDPNRDVQPWLGWIAAFLVVVIVVVAVAMGMARTNNQGTNGAEIRMTPLVGGKEMPVATETGSAAIVASEVTPAPEAITTTSTISMVKVINAANDVAAGTSNTETSGTGTSNAITSTASLTSTGAVTSTAQITPSHPDSYTIMITEVGAVAIDPENDSTEPITATAVTTAGVTAAATITSTTTVSGETSATNDVGATATSTAAATVAPTPTARPPATPTAPTQQFEVGDQVIPSGGRVEIYADSGEEATVLDSYGANVVLEVLDPNGDTTGYPVMVDGQSWLRVRAADGLVGWVKADQVEAQ